MKYVSGNSSPSSELTSGASYFERIVPEFTTVEELLRVVPRQLADALRDLLERQAWREQQLQVGLRDRALLEVAHRAPHPVSLGIS